MSTLRHNFNDIAAPKQAKAAPPPFALRLTFEVRQRLEADAGDMPPGAFIRKRLLGDGAAQRKRKGNSPVTDKAALARVLGALGQSRLSSNLNQLAKA